VPLMGWTSAARASPAIPLAGGAMANNCSNCGNRTAFPTGATPERLRKRLCGPCFDRTMPFKGKKGARQKLSRRESPEGRRFQESLTPHPHQDGVVEADVEGYVEWTSGTRQEQAIRRAAANARREGLLLPWG
jgi:hypothetical protein